MFLHKLCNSESVNKQFGCGNGTILRYFVVLFTLVTLDTLPTILCLLAARTDILYMYICGCAVLFA